MVHQSFCYCFDQLFHPSPPRARPSAGRGNRAPGLTGDAQEMGTSLGLRDLLLVDKATNGVAGLRTDSEPMLDAFGVELNLRGLFQRIVGSHQFNYTPVPWLAAFNHHHAIERFLLLANPGQTNSEH